ncbi:hypothetical protein C8J56DRAFT_1017690 [Mycena floridula]|nr:hypothetical protein C8J56DRAFT_1017690 [Mycena floridula]
MSGPIRNRKTNSSTSAGSRYHSGGTQGRLGRGLQRFSRTQVLASKVKEGFSAVPSSNQDNDFTVYKEDADMDMEEAIVEGETAVPISHEGGEWGDIEDLWAGMLHDREKKSVALVRQGLFPCSPLKISVAISTATLELYRSLFVRCPRLTIQPFIKTLCDLHGVPFRPYLTTQFSISFDIYLDVLRRTRQRVAVALDRHGPDWRLANACPSCLYELEGEKELKYSMFFTMDGNDSLKRMHRCEKIIDELGERIGETKERIDSREGGGDYFMPRKEVDEWDIHLDPDRLPQENADQPAGCDSWHNSQESNTRAMWRIYDETGLFLSVCRHGFVLLMADMVNSGELMKYAIAILSRFFGVLPKRLGGGYDIGCSFDVTLRRSRLGPKALEELYASLVGLFHGYSHNRLCQLLKLVLYLEGMGLEDFETCERYFSGSNSLATAIRHASIFHRRQAITEYARHYDSFHTYANLSTFLCNNYKQALDILATEPALKMSMKEMGLTSTDVFPEWLKDELEYLRTRVKAEVPEREKLEIEYYLLLVKFKETWCVCYFSDTLQAVQQVWIKVDTPETVSGPERDKTATIETKRRQARERFTVQLEEVQALENRLAIMPQNRWVFGDVNWVLNAERAAMSSYQKRLDRLEGLVVERMLELEKMNQSQTGYNMRKHIGQAVKTRSQAIRTALENYNAASAKLNPPRAALDWDTVIECAFLSEFEMLRDSRQDIRNKPWAKPAGRSLQNQYYKIQRAREEIIRCNIEISRLWTHMVDEKVFLEAREQAVSGTNPALAYQICQYRLERGRYDAIHVKRLTMLAKDPGFTGSLAAGKHRQVPVFVPPPPPPVTEPMADDNSDGLTDADVSGDDDDGLTDADASGDDDDEVLEWWVNLVDVATDNVK